jgi:hypothetical protein
MDGGASAPYLFSVAQTSKSAVSRVSKPAGGRVLMPTWKSAAQQVWKPALRNAASFGLNRCSAPLSERRGINPALRHVRPTQHKSASGAPRSKTLWQSHSLPEMPADSCHPLVNPGSEPA